MGGSGLAACCLSSYPAKPLCCLAAESRRRWRRWRAAESLAGGCQGQEQARCRRAAIRLLEGLYGIVQPAMYGTKCQCMAHCQTVERGWLVPWCPAPVVGPSSSFQAFPRSPALCSRLLPGQPQQQSTAHIAAQINHLLHPSPLSFRGN